MPTRVEIVRTFAERETVAAGSSEQAIGATGKKGDLFEALILVPASTSPGAVSIKDGSGSAVTVFAGGASSLADLKPFRIDLGIRSTAGAWKVTTGTNISAIAVGDFT